MLSALLVAALVQETLPNGMEVTILADPTMPVVATQIWYHVGSANEADGSRGLAHLFEHLMFGATATHERGDYDRFVTSVGGEDNAYTSPDETIYVSEVPPQAADEILRREADRMRSISLTQQNLDNEKKIVTEELRLGTENDPTGRLLVQAQRALLGTHPYAHDPSGSKADIAAATVASCRAFFDAYYHPNNAHLIVVGPVDPERELATVREAFGTLAPGGSTPNDVPPLVGWSFPSGIELKEDIPPVEVALVGVPLPPANSSDGVAVELLLEVLAGGSVDPLREIVVSRRKKAIEAGIETIALRRGGGVVFYSASLPYRRISTAMRVLDDAVAELDGMGWLTEGTLASGKRRLLEDDARTFVFAAERAREIGQSRWWLGDSRLALDRASRVNAVTVDDVAAAWRKYVREAKKIRVYVKPEHVPAYIRLFGWLYPLFS
jgi:zinc protease